MHALHYVFNDWILTATFVLKSGAAGRRIPCKRAGLHLFITAVEALPVHNTLPWYFDAARSPRSQSDGRDGFSMEHLPYPENAAFPRPDVPYVCTEPYDCGDFLTYPDPDRANYPQAKTPAFRIYDRFCGPALDVFEDFMQRWLFFGLLHALLQDVYREDDFIEKVEGERFVCTTRLPAALQAWATRMASLASEEREKCSTYLQHCLQTAFDSSRIFGSDHRITFDRNIRMSINALGETIALAVARTFEIKYDIPTIWWNLPLKHGGDPSLQDSMVQSGWCVSDASFAFRHFLHTSTMHYLAALRPPMLGRDHTGCTTDFCQHRQIDIAHYRSRHVPGCHCDLLGPKQDELATVVDSGSIPVLKISGDNVEDVSLEVVKSSDDTPYVALSHVWADGLGNPREHRLPRCQLLRMINLISNIKSVRLWDTQEPETTDFFLWCDSLCVPPYNPEADTQYQKLRDSSMGRMRQVYENATYVLILDATLEYYDFENMPTAEAGLRLGFSPWMRRLWTYQEVYLARHPLIKFADCIVDFRRLWQAVGNLRETNLMYQGLSYELETRIFRSMRLHAYIETNSVANILPLLATHLSSRQVSVASDEAVCLSVLLDLDTLKITETPESERMAMLWKMIASRPSSIRQAIIFAVTPKLEKSPFRWAPKSIMHSRHLFFAGSIRRETECSAQGSPNGLIVKYPAWKLHCPDRADMIKQHTRSQLARRLEKFFTFWSCVLLDEQGCWWNIHHRLTDTDTALRPPQLLFDVKHPIIINSGPNLPHCDGLMGKFVKSTPPDPDIVRSIGPLVLRKHEEHDQRLWNAAHQQALKFYNARTWPSFLSVFRSPKSTGGPSDQHSSWYDDDIADWRQVIAQNFVVPNSGEQDFAWRVSLLFLGRYFVVEQAFDESTEWCVD